jgi:hypothetical protein
MREVFGLTYRFTAHDLWAVGHTSDRVGVMYLGTLVEIGPPSGCRFHTRCWLYEKLGRPENCRTVDPELRIIGSDHRAACHYAEEAQQSDVGVAHIDRGASRPPVPQPATAATAAAQASAPEASARPIADPT